MPRPTQRLLRQNVVYWAPDTPDKFGNTGWIAGVEIKGRWEEGAETVLNTDGENVISRARVYVDDSQSIDQDGRFFLGQKADLTTAQIPDPDLVPNAYRIVVIGKTQDVRNRRGLKKIWLR